MNKRIILAGGGGFLGRILTGYFLRHGDDVVVLTRSPRGRTGSARETKWDGKTVGDWIVVLDGADVVINLTGRSVDCRYTATNRKAILASRLDSTRVLGEAIAKCRRPLKVWLNSSTATIYKHSVDRPMDEAGEIGATPAVKDEFSVKVAQAWEQALNEAPTPQTRRIALRTAMVLGPKGGVFPVLRRLVKFGLGGQMAGGLQYVSWLHETDFCRAIAWLMNAQTISGAVNLAAPNPVPNRELMRILRQVCNVPVGLPATTWMLEIGAFLLGTETELILKSRRVVPGRLLASEFQFKFPDLREALENLNG